MGGRSGEEIGRAGADDLPFAAPASVVWARDDTGLVERTLSFREGDESDWDKADAGRFCKADGGRGGKASGSRDEKDEGGREGMDAGA